MPPSLAAHIGRLEVTISLKAARIWPGLAGAMLAVAGFSAAGLAEALAEPAGFAAALALAAAGAELGGGDAGLDAGEAPPPQAARSSPKVIATVLNPRTGSIFVLHHAPNVSFPGEACTSVCVHLRWRPSEGRLL